MATAYPTGLDNFANPAATDALTGHAGKHTDLNDAVEALEAKVGVNGSAVATSLDAKVAKLEKLGTLGYAQVTANQPGITAEADLTGLSVAVTVGAGRRIRISVYGNFFSLAASWSFRIKEGATVHQTDQHDTHNGNPSGRNVSVVLTPTAGAHTYKASFSSSVAATLQASATQVAYLLVEDIGAA